MECRRCETASLTLNLSAYNQTVAAGGDVVFWSFNCLFPQLLNWHSAEFTHEDEFNHDLYHSACESSWIVQG